MKTEEIVERGIRAQELLLNPVVGLVVDDLIKQITETFLGSLPEDHETRKRAYFAYQGVKDVIGILNQWVVVKEQIIAAQKADEDIEEGN